MRLGVSEVRLMFEVYHI